MNAPQHTEVCGPNNDEILIFEQQAGILDPTDSRWASGVRTIAYMPEAGYSIQGPSTFVFQDANVSCETTPPATTPEPTSTMTPSPTATSTAVPVTLAPTPGIPTVLNPTAVAGIGGEGGRGGGSLFDSGRGGNGGSGDIYIIGGGNGRDGGSPGIGGGGGGGGGGIDVNKCNIPGSIGYSIGDTIYVENPESPDCHGGVILNPEQQPITVCLIEPNEPINNSIIIVNEGGGIYISNNGPLIHNSEVINYSDIASQSETAAYAITTVDGLGVIDLADLPRATTDW